jgi:restriction system protein
MRRRNSVGLTTSLLNIAAKVPWQVSVIAAVALFVTLHLTANIDAPVTTTPATMGPFVVGHILWFLATILQYVVPVLLLIGAVVSAVIRKRRHALHSAVVHAGRGNVMRNLTWQQFEKFIGAHFVQQGFAVEETGKPGPDGGVDLKLRRGKDGYLVQCKQWRARQVGVAAVRELHGVMASAGAVGGFVVTSGKFSDEARKFAKGREIELIDGRKLKVIMRANRRQPTATPKSAAPPQCPTCGSPMLVRVARKGSKAGKAFWSCPRFPACRGMLPALNLRGR